MAFRELVVKAYQERLSLGEKGFYATPGVDFNRETGRGTPFLYYTNGVAAAEVLIDRFTGELKVVRADLLMDAGKCINPGIDRGQITGGFIQGMGWVTTEELKYSDRGRHTKFPTSAMCRKFLTSQCSTIRTMSSVSSAAKRWASRRCLWGCAFGLP